MLINICTSKIKNVYIGYYMNNIFSSILIFSDSIIFSVNRTIIVYA